jgi:hypothetical protein
MLVLIGATARSLSGSPSRVLSWPWWRLRLSAGCQHAVVEPRRSRGHPLMLDMRVIFMDVAVGRWGLPSVEMETLLWRSPTPV